jgi:hypothetical protein
VKGGGHVFEWIVLMGQRLLELILFSTEVGDESIFEVSCACARMGRVRLTAGSWRSRIEDVRYVFVL